MSSAPGLPLISVVIASYNGERYIREQLDSILQQTYPNLEIIIIDDKSKDGTLEILKEYAATETPGRIIKLVSNDVNLGYVKNFEKGFLLANGSLIAPSDQDDVWHKSKISVLYDNITDHEIIYCNSELIDENGKSIGKKMSDIRRQRGYHDCLMYTIGSWAPGHAMLITKELIHRAAPFPVVMSHDLWLGFVATCKGAIRYLDTPLVYYRQHTSNVFGAIKSEGQIKKKKPSKQEELNKIRLRMRLMYEKCPNELVPQKQVLHDLNQTYQDFSLLNNYHRMMIFFKYRDKILAYKNKLAFGRWLFCFKMFVKIK